MADFVEVVKNAESLCENMEGCFSSNCPLNSQNNGRDMDCEEFRDQYPKEYEAIVQKWVKEYPLKTNKDKLMELMASAFGENVAKDFVEGIKGCDGFDCPTESCESCEYRDFWDRQYKEQKE